MKEVRLSPSAQEKSKKLGVGIIYFFGSRAQGSFLDYSDYDIGVVFADKKMLEDNRTDIYLKIYEILSQEIPETVSGPKLDISFLQTANPALKMSAVKYGKILFESDPVFRADFEEQVIKDFDDYLPLKREYEEATFSAFK